MSIHVPEEIERKADEICHNNADVEVAWATKCHMFAEEHEKLLAETPRNAMVELSGCVAHRVPSSVVAVPHVQPPSNGVPKEGRMIFSLLPTPLASLVLHSPVPQHPHYSFGPRSITVPLFVRYALRTGSSSTFCLSCRDSTSLSFLSLLYHSITPLSLLRVLFSFSTHVPLPSLLHTCPTSTSFFSYFSSFSLLYSCPSLFSPPLTFPSLLPSSHALLLFPPLTFPLSILDSCDDELYKRFRLCFPKLDCGIINEEEMKSPAARRVWGPFCAGFEHTVFPHPYRRTLPPTDMHGMTHTHRLFHSLTHHSALE